jgi:adenosyl cobinamide kinase/adenosyl cobinamide phosphate guanylyltransferase
MSLVVFTGGARSGKSAAAQELAQRRALDGTRVAALVFGIAGDDSEMVDRIARHQAGRPEGFDVVEVTDSRSLLGEVDSESLLLLDCLGTLVGMVMAEEWPAETEGGEIADAGSQLPPGYADRLEYRVGELVNALCERRGDAIVVTNEVGDGVVPAYATGRLFRDVLGRANRTLVCRADRAYVAVCGRLLELDALATSATWPED